jgi:excisionase family DNA binding protein
MPAQPARKYPQLADKIRRYASLADAAEYAACNERTLRRHIAEGDLTGYRLGRVYRVDLNEIDAWLTPAQSRKGSDAA